LQKISYKIPVTSDDHLQQFEFDTFDQGLWRSRDRTEPFGDLPILLPKMQIPVELNLGDDKQAVHQKETDTLSDKIF